MTDEHGMTGDPEKDTVGDLADYLEARPGWQSIPGVKGVVGKHMGSYPHADEPPLEALAAVPMPGTVFPNDEGYAPGFYVSAKAWEESTWGDHDEPHFATVWGDNQHDVNPAEFPDPVRLVPVSYVDDVIVASGNYFATLAALDVATDAERDAVMGDFQRAGEAFRDAVRKAARA